MREYFQVQDYSRNMKARVAIFNLNGRASIWWEHLRKVKNINDIKDHVEEVQEVFQEEVPF